MICGIDEAGRGSLIGPMIICIIYLEKKDLNILDKIGVKDSKKLTKHKRRAIFSILSKRFKYRIIKIEPEEIDLYVWKSSINELEIKKISEVLNEDKPEEIYIDSFYNNPRILEVELKRRLKYNCKIVSEIRADQRYPIVSAASIIAKVIRDYEIETLKKLYGDFGSGYPSDKKTIEYIKRCIESGNLPEIVRKSWRTVSNYMQKSLIK